LYAYIAPLPTNDERWKLLQSVKFPKTSKLSDETKLTCVEKLENAMPLAIARPFVEEFITDSVQVNVKSNSLAYVYKINVRYRLVK